MFNLLIHRENLNYLHLDYNMNLKPGMPYVNILILGETLVDVLTQYLDQFLFFECVVPVTLLRFVYIDVICYTGWTNVASSPLGSRRRTRNFLRCLFTRYIKRKYVPLM